jgi:hypothetical protein
MKRAAIAVPVIVALASPIPAAASRHDPQARAASTTIALGQGFGGLTAQRWPIAFGVNLRVTKIAWISTGLELKCSSGDSGVQRDGYSDIRVSKRGKFHVAFGPQTQRNADGTSVVAQGSLSGSFNRARMKASGKWNLKLTFLDAAGAVTDTCDSGSVRWAAVQ